MYRGNYPDSQSPGPGDRSNIIAPIVFLSVISIILAVAVGVILRQLVQYRSLAEEAVVEKNEVIVEKDDLLRQLDELQVAYDQLSQEHSALEREFSTQQHEINRLRAQIRGGTPDEVEKYKARIRELEKQLEEYKAQLDVLIAENLELSGENLQMRTSLEEASVRKTLLEEEKEKLEAQVQKASFLNVSNIRIIPINERRRGDRETDRARRVDRIDICFTIRKNPLIEPGEETFHVRIIDPDNRVLTHDVENFFYHQDQELQYSLKKEFDYPGTDKDVCVTWDQEESFPDGLYNVVIFHRGQDSGGNSIRLN